MVFLENLSLRKYLRLITVLVFLVLLVVGAVGIGSLQRNSSAASLMGLGKDVVADILPPPLYVIEAQLLAYDLARAPADQQAGLLAKMQQLKKDYADRNQFWTDSDLNFSVKEKLLGAQRQHADLFWAETEKNFLPAIAAGDKAATDSALKAMRKHYEDHRAGVEATVEVANKFAETSLLELTQTSHSNSVSMVVASLLGALLVFLAMRSLSTSLRQRIGGEPAIAVDVLKRIAQGDLSGEITLDTKDESSMLAAMKEMQGNLSALVREIQAVVSAAEQGDLGKRMQLAGKVGFGKEIGLALNQLMTVSDTSLQDVSRVASALATGDLSQKVEADYPGAFGQTARAVNSTVAALNDVVHDVRVMVDAASQGNFEHQMNAAAKQGYARTLAELLNGLSVTAHQALSDISHLAQALSAGDLTQSIERSYPGLFGETANGINATVATLRNLIGNVVSAVNAITVAAQEISAGNGDLSNRTEQQASSLEETAASMDQFTTTALQNTGSAKEANALAQAAAELAISGGEVVKASAETMLEIQESSRKISDIISVIEGISFQTNILALNAAVEAARAGEQGKGFAVVATEVRSLAHRSAQAAKEIAGLISDSGEKVARGTQQAQQAGKSMDQIVESISSVNRIVASISHASIEQSAGIGQVNKAIAQMDGATQQNAALVEEAAAAAESLEEQARELQNQVASFRLQREPQRQLAGPRHLLPDLTGPDDELSAHDWLPA